MNNNKTGNKLYVMTFKSSGHCVARILLFILLVLLQTTNLKSQTITIDSVLTRIENNNPALLSYTNKMMAADELSNGARALPAPAAGVEFDDNPYSFGFGSSIIRLSVSQDFPNTRKLNAKEDYLKSISDIVAKEGDGLKNKLFAEAKSNYFERYISEQRIEVMKENIKNLTIMLELSNRQFAISSTGDLSAVYKFKARLASAESILEQEENKVKSLTVALNYLMNIELKTNYTLDTSGLIKNYKDKIAGMFLQDSLVTMRSDVQNMESKIKSLKLNQKMVSMESTPDFGIRVRNYFPRGSALMYSVEGMMTIPIAPWSAKGYKSEVKSMGYEIEAMEQDKQSMINMANREITNMLIEMNASLKIVENYKKKVIPAYKKSLDVTLLAVKQNTNELFMALFAYDDLQMAELDYLMQLSNYFNVQIQYEKEVQIR